MWSLTGVSPETDLVNSAGAVLTAFATDYNFQDYLTITFLILGGLFTLALLFRILFKHH